MKRFSERFPSLRTCSILVTACIAAYAVTGCDKKAEPVAPSPAGPVELTVWAWDKSFNGFALEQADALDDSVTVNFVEMGKAAVLQKLHTVLAAGITTDLPDIVLISDLAVQGYLLAYPGSFESVDDVIKYSDFAPYKKDMVSYQGVGYGVPFDTGVTGLFYRKDYMAEAGYSAKEMRNLTWDQYISMGEKLKAKGHYLQTFNPNDISDFQIMLQSAGSWYTDAQGAANFADNAALKEAFRIFMKLSSSNCKVVSDWSGFAGAINRGDVAAVIRGCWISSTIMNAPDQVGKWAVAEVPRLSLPGAVNASNQGGSSWFVLKQGAHPAEAKKFLAKTFGGSVDLYNTLLGEKNILGTYLPASSVAAYQAPIAFYDGQKLNADLASWLAKIPSVNTGVYTAEAQAALTAIVPKLLGGAKLETLLGEAAVQFERSTK